MARRRVSTAVGALGVAAMAVLAMGDARPPKLGDPLPNVTRSEQARFNAGKAGFQVVETVAIGLGPVFNDVSCVACHSVGAVGGGNTRVVTRFGSYVGGVYDSMTGLGGSLIQSQGIGQLGLIDYVGETVPTQATQVTHRRTTPLFG